MTTVHTTDPHTRKAFGTIRTLVLSYLAIGVLALVAVVLMRGDAAEVNDTVWGRTIGVVASALLLTFFTARAAKGSRNAYWRLRIVSIVTPAAIVVLVALPGVLPLWMRIEQSVCGLLMIAVAVLAHKRDLRAAFARRVPATAGK